MAWAKWLCPSRAADQQDVAALADELAGGQFING